MTATLTSKNQLTMPREIRDWLGVSKGDQVDFVIGADGVVTVKPVRPKRSLEELYGLFASYRSAQRPSTVEEFDDLIAEVVAEDHERIFRGET